MIDKQALRDELARMIAADLDTRERAHRAAREGATHEEARPENDKDTRALEQSYLARGEAVRVEQLRTALADVQATPLRAFREGERAALGAVITLEEDGEELVIWLAPQGGGSRLADGRVQVVTPPSPLGRALLGKVAGDDVTVAVAGRTRELSILRVE
ncbi:MAG TPA: GreA/GreB family elongation factor [Polyangiaceae bacterium]|nr:GreA/GreB family elongation factor [Polyangiaceae bacterium]